MPVWIENLNRVMPKGEFLPIPLLCTVTFGAPLRSCGGEDKAAFLDRARTALLALAPQQDDAAMTATQHTLVLFAGIAGVLVVASHRRLRARAALCGGRTQCRPSTTSTAASRPGG